MSRSIFETDEGFDEAWEEISGFLCALKGVLSDAPPHTHRVCAGCGNIWPFELVGYDTQCRACGDEYEIS